VAVQAASFQEEEAPNDAFCRHLADVLERRVAAKKELRLFEAAEYVKAATTRDLPEVWGGGVVILTRSEVQNGPAAPPADEDARKQKLHSVKF
jgi:hypothetical protein